MARKSKKVNKKKAPSVYTILDKWIFDGSQTSPIPNEIVEDKRISPNFLLYFFSGTKYSPYISKYFNNFGIYQLDRLEVFEMIKDIVQRTAFVPRWKRRYRTNRSKLFKALWKKFPYLKADDIVLLAENVEEMECRDTLFEMFGIEKPKKVKEKKKSKSKTVSKKKKEPSKPKNSNSMVELLNNFEISRS